MYYIFHLWSIYCILAEQYYKKNLNILNFNVFMVKQIISNTDIHVCTCGS